MDAMPCFAAQGMSSGFAGGSTIVKLMVTLVHECFTGGLGEIAGINRKRKGDAL